MKRQVAFQWKLPTDYLLKIIPSLIFMQKRDFSRDSKEALRSARIKIEIIGRPNIPKKGPVLFLINHFSTPGFSALWLAMSLSASCPGKIIWTMTDAWTFPNRKFRKLFRAASHLVLARIAKVYGFFTFQPISPDPIDIMEQALSVRRILHFAKAHPNSFFSIAPEGRDTPNGNLGNPPPGAGLLIKAFMKLSYCLIPVSFYAASGTCHLNFGKSLSIKLDNILTKEEMDRQISATIMKAIAKLLPDNTLF
jgi:1-acyl-sn-glycerol-3-phosphate acyltransferase